MAGERQGRDEDAVGNPSYHKIDGRDFISSLPDEIIQHIFSFILTSLAVKTSVLSKRWRHVWCQTPHLHFDGFVSTVRGIYQTLVSYKAPKIMSFNLCISFDHTPYQIHSLIHFALSRNVQKVSITLATFGHGSYSLPDFFYFCSSIKQLSIVRLRHGDMIPKCTVSWKSLRNLSLSACNLSDESIAKILCGCPKLESLTLHECDFLERLDLSKSHSLTRLDIICNNLVSGPTEIVAPHIHYLRFTSSQKPCNLVDVSSLIQADLDIRIYMLYPFNGFFPHTLVLKMLAKLHNVEMLTVGATILKILSLAEGVRLPFPMLKVQTLIVKTRIVRSVIPGIARLLQNSPCLKKLIAHATQGSSIRDEHLESYLNSQGVNMNRYWESKYSVFPTSQEFSRMLHRHNAMSKLLDSFVNLVLENAKTVKRVVVRLGEEQLQMVRTLSHKNNVSIELKRSK